MGLDVVEFIMDIEDEFDIRIDDADSYGMSTCRDVTEYILTHIPAKKLQTQRCITQTQFYLMRKRLMQEFNLPRHSITPTTPLQQCLTGQIKSQWSEIKSIPEFSHLPPLECPRAIQLAIPFMVLIISLFLVNIINLHFSIAIPTILLLWWLMSVWIPDLFASKIPIVYETMGGLARTTRLSPFPMRSGNMNNQIASQNADQLLYEHTLKRVIRIASKITDIPEEKISPNAHIIQDLGMDS